MCHALAFYFSCVHIFVVCVLINNRVIINHKSDIVFLFILAVRRLISLRRCVWAEQMHSHFYIMSPSVAFIHLMSIVRLRFFSYSRFAFWMSVPFERHIALIPSSVLPGEQRHENEFFIVMPFYAEYELCAWFRFFWLGGSARGLCVSHQIYRPFVCCVCDNMSSEQRRQHFVFAFGCHCRCCCSCLPPTTTVHPHEHRRQILFITKPNSLRIVHRFIQTMHIDRNGDNKHVINVHDTKKVQNIYRIKDATNKDTVKNPCFSYINRASKAEKNEQILISNTHMLSLYESRTKKWCAFSILPVFFCSCLAVCCWCKRSQQIFTLIRGYDWQWK